MIGSLLSNNSITPYPQIAGKTAKMKTLVSNEHTAQRSRMQLANTYWFNAILAFSLGLFLTTNMTAQTGDVEYLDHFREMQVSAVGASYIRTNHVNLDKQYVVQISSVLSGNLIMSGTYSDSELTVEEGVFHYYFANGEQESIGNYEDGVKKGNWKRWDWLGVRKPDRIYAKVSSVEL